MTASFRGVVGVQILVESCDCLFFTRVQVCDENGELITTETRDDVRATETAIKNGGGLDERVVAFVMSKLVVDPLHAIKVDEEKQQLFFLTASKVEVRCGLFEQAATVEQSCQVIFERAVAQRLFEVLTLGNVAHDLDQTATVDARDRNLQWKGSAAEFQAHCFAAPRSIAPYRRHDLLF